MNEETMNEETMNEETMNEETMNEERIINVPIDIGTKKALKRRAKANDRPTCREAAAIIKSAVKKEAEA